MSLQITLWSVAALIATSILGVLCGRIRDGGKFIYVTCLVVSAIVLSSALTQLFQGVSPPEEFTLPLGIPWVGSRFRMDALGAFFLIVVNLGGAAASLYGLDYHRHESAPHRVLP